MTRARASGAALAACVLVAACTAGEASPTSGTYTVRFPSTAAAVVTEFVQIFVYDFAPTERSTVCTNLIAARKRKDDSRRPLFQNQPANICELERGLKPITVPYGEHAILAVGLRASNDFLVGCTVQTLGDGDAPVVIPLALVDVTTSVPGTNCTSVSQRCDGTCGTTQ